MHEIIGPLHRLGTGEVVDHEREFFRLENAPIYRGPSLGCGS